MTQIRIMVNGAPGNVASLLVERVLADDRFHLLPYSLTGPEITSPAAKIAGTEFRLIRPDQKESIVAALKERFGSFISIDFTHPGAVNENAAFYCNHGLPFVMGTTGGDRDALTVVVKASEISAVIAPNMAKQIVGFQAMMEYAAREFPGLFSGYDIAIKESHQKGKADTSGTAKAMVRYFKDLGCRFPDPEIEMVRDPEAQKNDLGVPEAYLGGHAWHTYALTSEDGTVRFSFTHNVNGRQIYIDGTLDAAVFLHRKIADGSRGTVFNMIDILKAGALR